MKGKTHFSSVALAVSLLSCASGAYASSAMDLSDVFQLAQSHAVWTAPSSATGNTLNKPALSMSVASSQALVESQGSAANVARALLLPTINLTASLTPYSWQTPSNSPYYSGGVTIDQPLFNTSSMSLWRSAKQNYYAADANLAYAKKTVLLNTIKAYFALLAADDAVVTQKAKIKFLKTTLKQTELKFQAGIATFVDVKTAEANYDQALADQVAFKNTVLQNQENLRLLTGQPTLYLAPLRQQYHYDPPSQKLSYFIEHARQDNDNLTYYRLLAHSARDAILAGQKGSNGAYSNSLPSVDLALNYSRYRGNLPTGNDIALNGWSASLNFTWNVFTGGSQLETQLQAAHTYFAALDTLNGQKDSLNATIASDYQNAQANATSLQANHQALIAAQASLNQSQAMYHVGATTLVPVLKAANTYYSALLSYKQSLYNSIIGVASLKYDAGILSISDINKINDQLTTLK